jgi:hypothetical protein
LLAIASVGVLAACSTQPTPTPSASLSHSAAPSGSVEPTATPIPRLSLPAPSKTDPISIRYSVKVDLQAGGSGKLTVVVTNLTQKMVPELVLRWPTPVRDTIYLAPFTPSEERIREGGDPLVQSWTKWVDGPGELGEPAGTTSLGWGPLLPGGTLTIPVLATRVAAGPITFDFQILNGEAVLTTASGPAWTQVTAP